MATLHCRRICSCEKNLPAFPLPSTRYRLHQMTCGILAFAVPLAAFSHCLPLLLPCFDRVLGARQAKLATSRANDDGACGHKLILELLGPSSCARAASRNIDELMIHATAHSRAGLVFERAARGAIIAVVGAGGGAGLKGDWGRWM